MKLTTALVLVASITGLAAPSGAAGVLAAPSGAGRLLAAPSAKPTTLPAVTITGLDGHYSALTS